MKLRWTHRALRDLQHLHEYIAEDSPPAAGQMVTRIRSAAQHLERHPRMGKLGRFPDTRELVIAATPHIVVYLLEENEIHIVAVIHSAMRWPEMPI